jgi:hypothetical protein
VDKFETNAAWFANTWSYVLLGLLKDKIGILMESLGNECLATVGPTHDPDASVRLSLNECNQLHYFINWILIDDLS